LLSRKARVGFPAAGLFAFAKLASSVSWLASVGFPAAAGLFAFAELASSVSWLASVGFPAAAGLFAFA
jgi:hypothetical protein